MINYPSLESIRKLIDLLAFPILCILVPFPTFASREGEKKRKGREEDPCRDFSIERFEIRERKKKKEKEKVVVPSLLGIFFTGDDLSRARGLFTRLSKVHLQLVAPSSSIVVPASRLEN